MLTLLKVSGACFSLSKQFLRPERIFRRLKEEKKDLISCNNCMIEKSEALLSEARLFQAVAEVWERLLDLPEGPHAELVGAVILEKLDFGREGKSEAFKRNGGLEGNFLSAVIEGRALRCFCSTGQPW